MILYKYIGIDKFYNMLNEKCFYLVNPSKWDDPYENFILRAFEPKSERQHDIDYSDRLYMKVLKKCKARCEDDITVKNMLAQIYYLSKTVFCTCMINENSEEREMGSDAMWRSYSNEKRSIRFEYDFDNILDDKEYYEVEGEIIAAKEVNYHEIDIDALIRTITSYDGDVYSTLFYKRETFRYENEVRLIVPQTLNLFLSDKDSEMFSKLPIDSRCDFVERFNDIFPVKVGEYKKIKFDIKKVKNVLIHPLAEESTIFIVKQMCEKFGLPEPKKSLLYDISENMI